MSRKRILLFFFFQFTCGANNSVNEKKIKFLIRPSDIIAVENDEIRFACKIIGRPTPAISWSKKDGHIPSRAKITDSSLYIANLTVEDDGEYVCRGSNKLGTIESSAKLLVQAVPRFTEPLVNQTVKPGENVTVTCQAAGRPKPAVHWSRQNSLKTFLPGYHSEYERLRVTENSDLHLYNVNHGHQGLYHCTAINAAGYSTTVVHVQVYDESFDKEAVPEFAAKRDESNKNVGSKSFTNFIFCFMCFLFVSCIT